MIRYMFAAAALKGFSVNGWTRKAYRRLGNAVGNRSRNKGIPRHYIQRAERNLSRIEKAGGIADGMHVLELGTGWAHWEALYTRLFYDVRCTLFDVWDNRQFDGFLKYCSDLRGKMSEEGAFSHRNVEKAQKLLDEVLATQTFEEAYKVLNFRYIINGTGSFSGIDSDSIDLIISSDVLEHIPVSSVPTLLEDMKRVLKPNGMSAHQIVPFDHLVIYDRTVNGKNYLRYSDSVWKALYENEVQYMNRLQQSEWIERFSDSGFRIVAEGILGKIDISKIKVAKKFESFKKEDLEATVTYVIAQKAVA